MHYGEKLDIGNDPDNDFIKAMDFGGNFLAGYQLPNGLLFSVNYNAGFSNMFPGGSNDGKLTSHYFGIKAGWMMQAGKTKKE